MKLRPFKIKWFFEDHVWPTIKVVLAAGFSMFPVLFSFFLLGVICKLIYLVVSFGWSLI